MFELKDVCKYYHNDGITNRGLNNVNLKLEKGEIVVITGESGSGKSTLLNVITKQDTFDEGEIYFYGNETSYFSIDDMDNFRKNKIGFIFQNYNIIDSYTVLENVMLPLIINDIPYKEAKAEALDIIKKVGLEKWKKNRGSGLSGGQKQRCVIARALASRCDVLACDEPTGNLDSQTGNEIVKLIKEVSKDKLVLIVTHNYDQFKDIATRKIKVHDGEIIEDTYIEKPVMDDNKELELDYVPVGVKTDSKIALNNLKSTPRKTMLMCIITLFTAFFAFFLYQIAYGSMLNSFKSNPFVNQSSNKVIAYNEALSLMDKDKLDGLKYESNLFREEETNLTFKSASGSTYNYYMNYQPYLPKNYSIKVGNLPTNEKEVFFLFPKSEDDYSGSAISQINNGNNGVYCKSEIKMKENKDTDTDIKFNISGVGYSKDITDPVVIPYSSKDEGIKALEVRAFFKFSTFLLYKNSSNYVVDFDSNTKAFVKNAEDTYNRIQINSSFNELYLFKDNIPVEVDEESSYLLIGSDYKDYENIYTASVYGNKKTIRKKLKKAGYSCIDVKNYDNSEALQRFINNFYIYLVVFLMSFIILFIYLIASIILSKVFSSKSDTYAIFRTLGVTKKDMKKILNVEVLVTVMSMTLLNLLFSIIIHLMPDYNFFFEVYKILSFKIIAIYLLIMLFIAILLSKKFNKKLFKNSVTKTLREEK